MSSLEELRELLFGDVPLRRWAGSGTAEPGVSFRHAADLIEAGDIATARQQLYGIIGLPHLESRHYLEAWAALRELGEQPRPSVAKHLYGIVLDVPVGHGSDTLAAYADYGCRYLNYSGRATIWEHPNDSLDEPIDRLFATGRTLVERIGPWQGSRPPLPVGLARISLLCPAGLHFGQAPFRALQADPMAAPVLAAGTALLQNLVGLAPHS